MSQLCLTHTAFYLFLKHARSFLTEGFLKDGIKRLQWLWQPCRLKGNREKEGGKTLKENETDTFISVDTELRRVTINCSVYEYGWWKGGRGMRRKFSFQSSSLSSSSNTPALALEKLNTY